MKLRIALPLAATLLVGGLAEIASAAVYDARTLGMGGNSVGYAGNASLAYWNPAAVARGNAWGVYLPNVGVSLTNNLLSVQDVTGLVGGLNAAGGLGSSLAPTFTKLGSSTGLNMQVQNLNEIVGFSLGKVGPGAIAVRLYNSNLMSAQATLSQDFANDVNGLFFGEGLTKIQETMAKVSSSPTGPAQEDIATLKSQLQQYMGSFIKLDANGKFTGNGTVKKLDLNAITGVNGALAATYAQAVPVSIPQLPEAELSLGATAKVLGSMGPAVSSVGAFALPGGNGAQLSPLGGGMGANLSFDMDKEVSELYQALEDFSKSQDLATGANVASKAGAFVNTGLGSAKVGFSSTTPNAVGLGLDLGAAMKLNRQWSVGAALADPLLLWGAKKTTYTYDLSGAEIKVIPTVSDVSFREGAPMIGRLGVAFTPELQGPPILVNDLLLLGGVEAPFFNSVPASFNLGVEKLFGPLALRLGTQQGGLAPLYTAGLGLQTPLFQLQLGGGVNNPGDLRSAAFALSMGAGF